MIYPARLATSEQSHSLPAPWGIRITAASRLSFTLIDMNGESGRRNGMASMSLADPAFQAVVEHAEENSVITEGDAEIHRTDIEAFIGQMQEQLDWTPVRLTIERGLPAHTGFGSKTTTLLAIGKACAALFGTEVDTEFMAQNARRAGTSGASVNLIDHGGFLVDGGHKNPDDFAEDPHRYLLPSRYAGAARKPPPLINLPFPPWPILLIVTAGTKLHGEPELEWFKKTLPIPAEEARRTAHHVLMNMAPAIAEADYAAFCSALNELTYDNYYKREQIAIQPPEVREMFKEARGREEIDAICISVTGPMCFAFTRQPERAMRWCENLRELGVVERYWFSSSQNHPCRIESWIRT